MILPILKKTLKSLKRQARYRSSCCELNSDNVNYEASATTPATTSSADTDSEDSEKSSKDEDKDPNSIKK